MIFKYTIISIVICVVYLLAGCGAEPEATPFVITADNTTQVYYDQLQASINQYTSAYNDMLQVRNEYIAKIAVLNQDTGDNSLRDALRIANNKVTALQLELNKTQEESANEMGLSQSQYQRDMWEANRKIVEAIIEGKGISIIN